MSLPRLIIPGDRLMLTRRCSERRLFMRPSPKINQITQFCLGVAAERTGVLVHAFSFLSNHYHMSITDPDGTTPEFMHWLNEYLAKCINAELGRWETFWAPMPIGPASRTLRQASRCTNAGKTMTCTFVVRSRPDRTSSA